jgi:hypothetical protein
MEGPEVRSLMSATSAVAWATGTGVTHHALYAIDKNDSVEVSVDGGPFTNLNFSARQVSAGLDVFNKPEVYAIGFDNAVYEDFNGFGFVPRGGYAKQISAGLDAAGNPEVFAIGLDDALYVNHGPGFVKLGGNFVTEVSAPAVDVGLAGDLAYAVGFGHQGLLHNGSFSVITGGTIE